MSKFHIALLESTDTFPRFQLQSNQGGQGIDFLLGVRPNGPLTLTSILFRAEKFSPEQIAEWMVTHRVGGRYSLSTEAAVLGGLNFDQARVLVQEAIDEQYPPLSQGGEIPYEEASRFSISRIWEDKVLAQRCYWSDPNDPAYFLFPYSIETDAEGVVGVKLGAPTAMKLQVVAVDDAAMTVSLESAAKTYEVTEAGRRNANIDAARLNQLIRLAASLVSPGDVDQETTAALRRMMKTAKSKMMSKESLEPREGEDPHLLESWNQLDGATFIENFTAVIGEGSAFNEKTMVVTGVSVLGPVSKNKRRYSTEVQKESLSIFEGAKAYLNHPTGREMGDSRRVQDLIGEHRNLRVVGDQTFSDLHLIDNQTTREHLVPIVKQKPHLIGNSIVVRGVSKRAKDGWEDVEKILEVRSIDVVAEPATTHGLYESEHYEFEHKKLEEDDMELKDLTIEELLDKRPDLIKLAIDNNKGKQESEQKLSTLEAQVVTLQKDLADREVQLATIEAEKLTIQKKEAIETLIVGAKVPDTVKYETTKEGVRQIRESVRTLLSNCPDQDAMKAAIATIEATSSAAVAAAKKPASTVVQFEQKIEESTGLGANGLAKMNSLFR